MASIFLAGKVILCQLWENRMGMFASTLSETLSKKLSFPVCYGMRKLSGGVWM
jgi:hypothetical protein